MNDVPKILEEPLLRSSRFFNYEIPLVSLEIFAFSAIGSQVVKGLRLTLRERTKNPRWVRRSWCISDCGRFPMPSEEDIDKDCRASCECSELILHS